MTISFLYWNMVLTTAEEAPCHYHKMCDDNLDACFAALVEGRQNVWVVCHKGWRHLVAYLHQHYRYVKAAGGVVLSPQRHTLLIRREEHWDLPKGMVEQGETLSAAALREVAEETGVEVPQVEHLLLKTYHIYNRYGGWHLKQTSWYEMHTTHLATIVPQTIESITEGCWATPTLRHTLLQSSYAMLCNVDQTLID